MRWASSYWPVAPFISSIALPLKPLPRRQDRPQACRAPDVTNLDDTPDEALSDRAFHLIGQARRLADRGKFAEATAKLDEADKVVPGLGETSEARRKIAELATPEGQFAIQFDRARTAVGNDDYAEAEKAMAEAERLKPQAPEIAELRQAMQARSRKRPGAAARSPSS